jgi:geranylgeranyl reductase family protein
MQYDVVVVGGGPAGASAARAAAQRGARVLVLERERLPRYKTCGGGLVGLSTALCGLPTEELDRLTRSAVTEVTWTCDGRWERTRRAEQPLFRMILRADFDAALIDAAVRAGAEIRDGVTVTAIDEDADGVVLTLRGADPVRADVVIGADGSASRIGGHVGVTCEQVDVGLEGEFPAQNSSFDSRVLLDWGPVPGSYGWLFPKGDIWTVGVIGSREDGAAVRTYYRDFLNRLGLGDVPAIRDTGHLTRCRTTNSPLRRGPVLVAGDAAGFLEPWSREGISYALRSGRIAGECAVTGTIDDYPRRVLAALDPEMTAGREILAAFQRHPLLFHAVLTGLPGAFGLFQRLIDGRTTLGRQVGRPGMHRLLARLADRPA